MEYTNDIKLIKRREKEMLQIQYESLKTVLDQKLEDMNKKKHQAEGMDLENIHP